jgi:hypothetical protein
MRAEWHELAKMVVVIDPSERKRSMGKSIRNIAARHAGRASIWRRTIGQTKNDLTRVGERPVCAQSGRSRLPERMSQLGGKRAYTGRLGKERSACLSRHSVASAEYA